MTRTLLIGIGNDLRRDDGVGVVVAERIAALGVPGVTVRTAVQLLPEMVEWFAGIDRLVIVDATIERDELLLRVVTPSDDPAVMSHHLDPSALLALAHRVGVSPPTCVVMTVPAVDLGLGEGLSRASATAADGAVALVLACLAGGGGRSA